ncbi:dimethyladenosine transferase 2, mitochondrial isoform X2 [Coccinella septempunctata]|nr:dimethyladenosine transferase 2, mitochondrial isoform X2 [Coccinella septempunctata]
MIQLYSKTFFKISQYDYSDRLDNGNRVQKLLKNVPKKGWTDDPAISVIGPILDNKFLQHVIYAISTQKSLVSYGRVEIFAIMRPSHYLVLSTEKDFYKSKYGYMTVLFNLFFDYKLLCKLPRHSFLPWERSTVKKSSSKLLSTDINMLYLVHIVAKKQFPLPSDQLVAFNIFMRKFFKRKARIIPILEYCVPDCGVHIMMPQLEHDHYFEHIGIFTNFEELTPIQIVGVFREMYHHPNYKGSPFSAIVEASIIKSEAVQTDYVPGPENSFIDEIEQLYEGCNLSEQNNCQ